MGAQNIYDDPEFFAGYAKLPRSQHGLPVVFEWPAFRRLLPRSLQGLRVLDLGCGTGALARELRKLGAREVVGIDLSERMLAEARARTPDQHIVFQRADLETFAAETDGFDLVVSSLALHYLNDFLALARRTAAALRQGGRFVFSVEHPIFTAQGGGGWITGPNGEKLHWPVDRYRDEGKRETSWIVDGVEKYHRTTETYVNGLIDAGLRLLRLEEPEAEPVALAEHPEWRDERRRPPFLLLAAERA
jgi:SAM-dependent methyltransferase